MRTLHTYILKEMLATIVVAVGVCAGLLLIGNLLKEVLSLLMSGQATLGVVLRGIALLVPFILVFALPMGSLTASLLVFGRLSADQELTAARANGISLVSLAVPVMGLSLVLCGVCAWVNLDLAPRSRFAYKELLKDLARQKAPTLIPAGRFFTDIPNFVLYVDRIDGGDLEDVLFFQLQNGRKILDVRAPRAKLEYDNKTGEIRLAFFDGRYLQWIPGQAWQPAAAVAPVAEAAKAEETVVVADTNAVASLPITNEVAVGAGPDDTAAVTVEEALLPEIPPVDAVPVVESNAVVVPPADTEVPTNLPTASFEGEAVVVAAAPLGGPLVTNALAPKAKAPTLLESTGAVVATVSAAAPSGMNDDEESAMPPEDEPEGFWQPIPSRELRASVSMATSMMSKGLPVLSDMTFVQLLRERAELLRLGIDDVTPLDVQLHRQVAFSFACFGFALVGIPLGVRAHRRETSVGIAFAIALVMVYYAFLIVAQAFDTRSDLLPWLIVWMPNALFQGVGVWLLWRVNRGR